MQWNSARTNGGSGGSVLSGEAASDAGLDATQAYLSSYSATGFLTLRARKMPLSGLDPSMLIRFLCKRLSRIGSTFGTEWQR